VKRAATLFATLASAALSLAGGSGAARAELAKWRHAVLEPKSDAGIILMAARHDFFKKLGLDVEIVELKNEILAQRAAVAGEIDSFEGSPPYAAIATGSGLRIVGCYWTVSPYHIFATAQVKTIDDMRGRTIAIAAPGSAPDMVARAIFDFHHVPADEVKFANVGSDADRYRAVMQGVVDATVVSSEYTPVAERDKLHSIATAREALPDYDRLCITMNTRSLTQRRADAVRFMAGEMQGLRHAASHRDETIALTREVTGQKPDDPRAAWTYDNAIAEKAFDPAIPLVPRRLEAMQMLMIKAGALNKSTAVENMIDPALREEAAALAAH
jgi:ABC-type nitrate/sulfonate/bicarbonate transport system substrate-binding protein